MSEFKGSIPTPEFDTGDLVKTKEGYGHIEQIRIIWTGKWTPDVAYFQLRTWWRAADIEGEFTKLKKDEL